MIIDIYNQKKEKTGIVDLPDRIFNVKLNPELVHQAYVAQISNARRPIAHTKVRREVSGGGRKPWAQKGTGRARHGSTRSPLWKGGGVTFGPTKNRNFSKKINKKAKQKALFMALSSKVRDKELVVLDKIELSEGKTKKMAEILNLFFNQKKVLVILSEKNEKIARAARNLPYAKTLSAHSLNVGDLLNYKYLLLPQQAIEVMEKTYVAN